MMDTYDMILAGIPTVLGGGGILSIAGVGVGGIVSGVIAAVFLIVYGMFVKPPQSPFLGPHQ